MKNIFKILFCIILAITVSLSAMGCGFVMTDQNTASNEEQQQVVDNNKVSENYSSSDFKEVVNEGSITYNNNITFGTYQQRTLMTEKEAYNTVKRTSVAIDVIGETTAGSGSGVIIDMSINGVEEPNTLYIITCHHMISSLGTITVYIPDENCRYDNENFIYTGVIGGKISDNSNCAVTLIGGDLYSDIALLKLDLTKQNIAGKVMTQQDKDKLVKAKVPTLNQNEYKIEVPDEVFSVGNPTGELPGTCSSGKISYLDREANIDTIGNMLLLQMDVTSNPGNSGGGLYNLYGELIGITNAGNTSYQNINFAIPYILSNDDAQTKYSSTENHGFMYVAERLLGTYSSANYGCVPGTKAKFGFTISLSDNNEIYIYSVNEGSLASGKLMKNDIITGLKINGEAKTYSSYDEFTSYLNQTKVGDTITLTVSRTTYSRVRQGGIWVNVPSTTSLSINLKVYQYWFCNQAD